MCLLIPGAGKNKPQFSLSFDLISACATAFHHLMEPRFYLRELSIVVIISNIFVLNDARVFPEQILKKPKVSELAGSLEPTNGKPYGLPSPLFLPPLESPVPLPPSLQSPLSCVGSPLPPPPHSTVPPTPLPSIPPPSPIIPIKSPPQYALSPPQVISSPPVHHPPPSIQPPPPHKKPQFAVWCVAKPSVPDSMIQEALDYACGSGADCKPIQPNGSCFQPDTPVAHASYAFNSYWQSRKAAGGTCDFGGTAMLVTTDPSYNDCYFIVN